ncbi:MAG: hypothetical protein ABW022_08695 [Actinoplanes sp.]
MSVVPNLPGTAEEIVAWLGGADARHSATMGVVRYFAWSHLPGRLKEVSQLYCEMMLNLLIEVPKDSPQLTTALNRLLESKDAAVRAALD